jgi:hypothetical protein
MENSVMLGIKGVYRKFEEKIELDAKYLSRLENENIIHAQ